MPLYPNTNITLSDTVPMVDDHSLGLTPHAALTADLLLQADINKKTAVRFWDNGTFQNGSPNTGDMIVFTDSTTVAGGTGIATFYLTSNHLSGGTALCSSIILNSVRGGTVDGTGNFNPSQPTVTSNKTIGIPYTRQGNNGVTLLGINVLTNITFPATPDGTTITLFAIGISV